MRSKCAGVAIALFLLVTEVPLSAQPNGAPQPPSSSTAAPGAPSNSNQLATARKRYNEGAAFAQKQEWKKAYEAFADAWRLIQNGQIAVNLGHAELKVGKYCSAIAHLNYFLDATDPASADAALARGWLAEAKKNGVMLTITVESPGAVVLLDGESLGTSPVPPRICVDAGKHTIAANAGNARDEVTTTFEPGTTPTVKLAPKRSPPPPATTTTVASTIPSAPPKEEPSGPRKEILIGGSAAAGAMFVAGAVFAGLSASKLDAVQTTRDSLSQGQCNLNGDDPRCKQLLSLIDERNGLATAAMWSYIGGMVFGGGTLAYWLLTPKPSTTAAPTIRARIALNPSGGLILDGVW